MLAFQARAPRSLVPPRVLATCFFACVISLAHGLASAAPAQSDGRPPARRPAPPSARAAQDRVALDGLRWLARHQEPDGSWSPATIGKRCTAGSCADPKEKFAHHYDTGATALALLAFVRAGHGLGSTTLVEDAARVPANGRRTADEVVRAGLEWLVRRQKRDGAFDAQPYLYNEAAVTTLLCEVVRATDEAEWRRPARRALAHLISMQRPNPGSADEGWGWRYEPLREIQARAKAGEANEKDVYDADLSCTGWVAVALDAARRAEFEVARRAVDGALEYVLFTCADNGLAGYQDAKMAGKTVTGKNDHFIYHKGTMSSLAMAARVCLGNGASDPFVPLASSLLLADLPYVSKDHLSVDYYYWHWALVALQLAADADPNSAKREKALASWRKAADDALTSLQTKRDGACAHGGWLVTDRWAFAAGPIYTTSMAVMSLAVPERDAPAKPKPPSVEANAPRLDASDPAAFQTSRKRVADELRGRDPGLEAAFSDAVEVHAIARAAQERDASKSWGQTIADFDEFRAADVLRFVDRRCARDARYAEALEKRFAQVGDERCSPWLARHVVRIDAEKARALLPADELVRRVALVTQANVVALAKRGLATGVRAQLAAAIDVWPALAGDVARAELRATASEAEVPKKELPAALGRVARAAAETDAALDALARAKDDADWWKRVRALQASFAALDRTGAALAALGGAQWSAKPAAPVTSNASQPADLLAAPRAVGGDTYVTRERLRELLCAQPSIDVVLVREHTIAVLDAREGAGDGIVLSAEHFGAPLWRVERPRQGAR